MGVRRPKEPGGRKIRHVVLVTEEEDARLWKLATTHGWSIPKLLMESTLKNKPAITSLQREVSALRQELAELNLNGDLDRFETAWGQTHSMLLKHLEQ